MPIHQWDRNKYLSVKNSISQELRAGDFPFFTKKTLNVAVQSKQFHQHQKGLGLVLNSAVVKDYIELYQYLGALKAQCSNIEEEQRLQLILNIDTQPRNGNKTSHWLLLDIQKRDQTFSFIMMDSAFLLAHDLVTLQAIQDYFPDAQMAYIFLKQQHDTENCASFAYDYACRLAKISQLHHKIRNMAPSDVLQQYIKSLLKNKFTSLPQTMTDEQILSVVHKTHCLPLQDCPYEFGPLLRNTQSMSMLKQHFWSDSYHGNETQTLAQYVSARSKTSPNCQGKEQNKAIDYKRRQIKLKTMQYQHELKQHMQAQCHQLDKLVSNLQQAIEHQQRDSLNGSMQTLGDVHNAYSDFQACQNQLKTLLNNEFIIDYSDIETIADQLQLQIQPLEQVINQRLVYDFKDICDQFYNLAQQMKGKPLTIAP